MNPEIILSLIHDMQRNLLDVRAALGETQAQLEEARNEVERLRQSLTQQGAN